VFVSFEGGFDLVGEFGSSVGGEEELGGGLV
jgi:hypothetical protein